MVVLQNFSTQFITTVEGMEALFQGASIKVLKYIVFYIENCLIDAAFTPDALYILQK